MDNYTMAHQYNPGAKNIIDNLIKEVSQEEMEQIVYPRLWKTGTIGEKLWKLYKDEFNEDFDKLFCWIFYP